MKRIIKSIALAMLILSWVSYYRVGRIYADWWQRPPDRESILPTRPLTNRENREPEPTQPVDPTPKPTSLPATPTVPVGGLPQATPTNTPSQPTNDGRKDEGKKEEAKQESTSSENRSPGEQQVQGLSSTAGKFGPQEMALILGVFCLALYARSKMVPST